MSHATYLVGDVFDRMADLPDGSVDLIVTSPPFLALRSYLPADHPDKDREIGSEATPAEFIDTLLALSAEWRRLLAPHGSIAVELGDTYSGSGGAGGDYGENGLRDGQPTFRQGGKNSMSEAKRTGVRVAGHNLGGDGWPLAKSKTLIPELYRIALAYGIHPLTGQPSPAGSWRIRNVVTWCRPNPPVGALGDKWRPATSDIVVACVSGKRYWDDVATRKPLSERRQADSENVQQAHGKSGQEDRGDTSWHTLGRYDPSQSAGAPLLDYWEIPPGGYPGSHYAVYPPALVEPLIKAMAPSKVCQECGEPSRRIVGLEPIGERKKGDSMGNGSRGPGGDSLRGPDATRHIGVAAETIGWTDCGHDAWRPALILDPFAGSGTTLMVATGHGHDAVGIDIDERNADLARERIGELFLTVEAA